MAVARELPASAPEDVQGTKATPLARRLAFAYDLAIENVAGSGADGQVRRADLPLRVVARTDRQVGRRMNLPQPVPERPELSGVDGVAGNPTMIMTARCRLDHLRDMVTRLNGTPATRGLALSSDDLLVRAVVVALTAVPEANVRSKESSSTGQIDLAVGVARNDQLMVRIVRGVEALYVSSLARQMRSAGVGTTTLELKRKKPASPLFSSCLCSALTWTR